MDDWDLIAKLYEQAAALPPEEREAFLERVAGSNPTLRAEVESLLSREALQETAGLSHAIRDVAASASSRPRAVQPPIVSGYQIHHLVGEGGMGEVWLAEQTKPVRRRVALKIIKRGLDTRTVMARFEAERQALAIMDHPNIAKVHDAGETADGRPYFTMEYVKGEPINRYCDRQRLTITERLHLFTQACEGVQHAHHKAVIHRDLKPSNILVPVVDGKATVKIIDFGVAKAVAHRLTERTLATELGVLIGTPEYMSPEQADLTIADIDTRTDVYSLGVVLYELLVGKLPFESGELREAGLEGIRRKILDGEPTRPSARLSSVDSAHQRRTEPETLRRVLSRDLDWITLKALEKDRQRRYGSPAELRADIERHLDEQPVVARPPSTTYRALKFARRHKAGVFVAASALALLVGFAATVTVLLGSTAKERDRANRESDVSQEVIEYLVGLFENANPEVSGAESREVTARELLARGAEGIRTAGVTDPIARARLLQTLGKAHGALRENESARMLLEESLSILEGHARDQPLLLAEVVYDLAAVVEGFQEWEACLVLAERALELRERHLEADDPRIAQSLTMIAQFLKGPSPAAPLRTTHDPERAATSIDRAIAIYEQARHEDLFVALAGKAGLAVVAGEDEEALVIYQRALSMAEQQANPKPAAVATLIENVSAAHRRLGQLEPGLRMAERSLALKREIYGEIHPQVSDALNWVARYHWESGNWSVARRKAEQALRIMEEHYGPDSARVLYALQRFGDAQLRCGRYAEAVDTARRLRETAIREFGSDPHGLSNRFLGIVLRHSGDLHGAREALEEALALAEPGQRDLSPYLEELAILESRAGNLRRSLELFQKVPDKESRRKTILGLARVQELLGQHDGSLESHKKALEQAEGRWGREHPRVAEVVSEHAWMLGRLGRYDEAARAFERTIGICEKRLGPGHPLMAQAVEAYAALLRAAGRTDDARAQDERHRELRASGRVGCDLADP